MAGSLAGLFAGQPLVHIGLFGVAVPELDNLTPPLTSVTAGEGWTETGFVVDVQNSTYTPTHEFHEPNAHTAAVKAALVKEEFTVVFTLEEADLKAYSQAINAGTLTPTPAAPDQVGKITFGAGDGSLVQNSLLLIGASPAGEAFSRVLHVPLAIQTDPAVLAANKGVWDPTAVLFTAMADITQAPGERLFKYTDILVVADS